MILPPRLRPGSTIGIAAVSGPVDPVRLERGIAALRSRGYAIREASNLRRREGLFAGSDSERAEGYRGLLEDPAVDAIFFARGGWGSSRMIDAVDPAVARRRPKIHLGGSDVTALLVRLGRGGLVTFYGPMVAVEMAAGEPLDWEDVLAGSVPAPHRFSEGDVVRTGEAQGPLLGGCLSILASLCGTPDALSARGALLLLEDVHEPLYRVDRLLTQLERSGTFDGIRGIVMGSLALPEGDSEASVRDWLVRRFAGVPFPVAAGLPAGHLARPRTIPLGTTVRLELSVRGELSFLGPAVGEGA